MGYHLIILCFLGCLITFLVLNLLYKQTNSYKNTIKNVQKFIDGVPNHLYLVNTGSTYARYAYDFSIFEGVGGFNFAIQPQTLAYDYKILSQYKTHLEKGCVVLITLCLFSFCVDDYPDDSSNTKYYYFLNNKFINGYSSIKNFLRLNFPLTENLNLVKRIFFDVESENLDNDHNTIDNAIMTSNFRIENWCKEFGIPNMKSYFMNETLNKKMEISRGNLKRIITLCNTRGWKPVIVIPPVANCMKQLICPEIIQRYLYDNLQDMSDSIILDYFKRDTFDDYRLYCNCDFLNATGRSKFMTQLSEDLKRLKLLQ